MNTEQKAPEYSLSDLLYLMSRLRDPETGCPWDIKQSYETIVPSTLEEAYEVADTIERGDYGHLKEELGDLLFQVIFYSQLGKEDERFTFEDVVDALTQKLVRRHPHVFPEGTLSSKIMRSDPAQEAAIKANWEAIKEAERSEKGKSGVLDDVPVNLPALTRASKLQKRAAKVGFDWSSAGQIFNKIREEVDELEVELSKGADSGECMEELGDVIFSCVNLARFMGKDSESIVRQANRKFEQRFKYIEQNLAEQELHPSEVSIERMESLWKAAKKSGL